MEKILKHQFFLKSLFLVFFIVFTSLSVKTMIDVPFYDFDEAHRAENVKRMKEYESFFVPLTGSSQDRVQRLSIPLRENSDLRLYYHLERPPLVYDLMILSTTLFGSHEWAYRLPSFLMGIAIFLVFLFFAHKEGKDSPLAIASGLLALFTSSDLWLSSQYAQMDTSISFFLFLSLLTLITFCHTRKFLLIYLSGIFLGLSLLSKLQPSVIFLFPLLYLLIAKKMSFADLAKFVSGFLLVFLPWLFYLVVKFGLKDVFYVMPGFAFTSASIIDIHHKAPIFWYVRWWWESFRPGWTIFLGFLVFDIFSGHLNWKKKALIAYIGGGLIAFSIPINKIWWYVLPLIPAVGYYIFLSVRDYLEKHESRISNLSFAIIVASLPIFLRSSNTQALIYGIAITIVVLLILTDKLTFKINILPGKKRTFCLAIFISLLFFLLQFPKIIPYHINTKEVSEFYKNIPGKKCLWIGDMPTEAVLFYSNAGEVPLLNTSSQIFTSCKNNYLITPDRYKDGRLLLRKGNIRLYQLTKDRQMLNEP